MSDTRQATDQQLDLDEIETRAAHLHEYALLDDEPMQADADQLTGKDVPALLAALRDSRAENAKLIRWHREDEQALDKMRETIVRLRVELAELSAAMPPDAASEATSATLRPVHASSVSESAQSPTGAPTGRLGDSGPTAPPRRTLTPNEYDAAWHAVEGAAGDEGADPGTVLHAVLDRLGIEWQDAAQPAAR